MPAQPLTSDQKADAELLRASFKEWQATRRQAKLPSSQADAAEALGFGQSALSQYLNGSIPLNLAAALKFEALLGTSFREFAPSLAETLKVFISHSSSDNVGAFDQNSLHDMVFLDPENNALNLVEIKSKGSRKSDNLIDLNVEPGPEIRGKLPLISWAQASAWESVVENFVVGDAEEWIAAPMQTSRNAYYLRVRGESMFNPEGEPSFREGDLILVEPQNHADHNALIVVQLGDNEEATFKQLIVEDGQRYLKALNPAWPNRITLMDNLATILGVVKTKIVRY